MGAGERPANAQPLSPDSAPSGFHVTADICPSCGYAETDEVMVTRIEATAKGWRAVGILEPEMLHCPSCGAAYNALIALIPIECGAYPCPNCNDVAHLTYRIHSIERMDEGFSFTADVGCANCHHRGILKRAIDQLSRITKVKLGPTGIEIERTPPMAGA